jgi:thiol:disulfide interchange protein DsbA
MKPVAVALTVLAGLFSSLVLAQAPQWIEGKHYALVDTLNRTNVPPGKTVVTEVFSYGCPACNAFNPTARKLRETMPKGTEFVYVPASFNAAEDWPMFQRAYITAQVLGVADKAHDAMFKAVWTTGELATMDPQTQALKRQMPTLEDAARFYNRETGVKVEDFLAAAKSFSVDVRIKQAEEFIRAYKVTSTPTLIVNGRYLLDVRSAGGLQQTIDLVRYLAAKDAK